MAREARGGTIVVCCATGLVLACSGEPKGSAPLVGTTGTATTAARPPEPGPTPTPSTSVTTSLPDAGAGPDAGPPAVDTPLVFSAEARPAKTRIGKETPIEITVRNTGAAMVPVRDPTTGDGSLVVHVTPPGGKPSQVIVGTLFGGTVAQVVNQQVMPGSSVKLALDLGLHVPFTMEGTYTVVLDYTWQPGQRWRSPEIRIEKTR